MFSPIPSVRAYNQSYQTFNSLNAFILKGEGAQGMDLTFATLMARAGDEPDAMYGLAAKSVQISADKLIYRFTLRPEARFHDGTKLTAHDAAFSLNVAEDQGPSADPAADARHARAPKRSDDATRGRHLRRKARARRAALCRQPADLLEGLLRERGRSTNRRSTRRSAPGPTRSASSRSTATSNTSASRIGGAPICRSARGSYNFDIVRYEFYRDRDVAFEGFTGEELSVPRGIHRAHLGDALRFPGHQGRPRQARDPAGRNAVRRAGLVHQYPARQVQGSARARGADHAPSISSGPTRPSCTAPMRARISPFQNSDMMAKGPPSPEELKLLEPFRGQVPDEVFGEPYRAAGVRRLGAGPRAAAQGPQLLQRGRLADQGRQAVAAERRGRSGSNSCSTSRRSSRTTRPTSRTSARSASRRACAWSIPCNTARGWKISIST